MSEPGLERRVGLIGAVGFGLGSMVGAGVFVYAAVGAGIAGPAVLVSLLLAAAAAACNGLSSAELAAVYPRSGGTYEYAGRVLSPWAGFLAGWLFLAAKSASAAATALGFGAYLGAATGGPALVFSFALVGAVTILNLFRLTRAAWVNFVLVGISVAALAAFVAAAAPRVALERFCPFAPRGVPGILSAAALLFVAYAGYGRVATIGEEIENPRRNIPVAIGLSLAAATVLYVLVTGAAVGTVGAEAFAGAARDGAPLREAAGPQWVKTGLTVGAAAALGSVMLNLMLGLSRMAFAMARGGDLPAGLAKVSPSSSPFAAVLLTGLAVAALVSLRDLVGLLSVSAFSVLVYYGLTNASSLRLRREDRLVPPAVPAAGFLFCLALAAAVPLRQLAVGVAVLGAGVLWRILWKGALRLRRKEA